MGFGGVIGFAVAYVGGKIIGGGDPFRLVKKERIAQHNTPHFVGVSGGVFTFAMFVCYLLDGIVSWDAVGFSKNIPGQPCGQKRCM